VEYYAKLGDLESNTCGLQGNYDGRLYCTFTLTEDMPGAVRNYYLFKVGCDDAVVTILNVQIPELPLPLCSEDLSQNECIAAGGEWSESVTRAPYCVCP
jgi:hypothetical protein